MTHDLGHGFVLSEYHEEDGLVGYTVSGPAAPACKSPHEGRCGGLCPTRPVSYPPGGRPRAVWEAEGEWPNITLKPSIVCDCGGQHGHVQNGRYVNAGGIVGE